MRQKKVITSGLGLIIIIAAIVIVFISLQGPPPVQELVLEVIELRYAGDEPIKKAGRIAKIDSYVERMDNEDIEDAWNGLESCLQGQCVDDDYFNFLYVIFTEERESIKNSEILINLIRINRYWGSEDVIEFSKSLSMVNDAIEEMDKKEIEKNWEKIVECNHACENENDLFFDLIKEMV